jgi:benzodiazapine receptor
MGNSEKKYLSLFIWSLSLIAIGSLIGSFTTSEISAWYGTLNRSLLTPPNYVFPIVWTVLYGVIGVCGSMIWRAPSFPTLGAIKTLYIFHLLLNWSWTPLFFHAHLTGLSFLIVVCMDILVGLIIYLTYPKMRIVSLLMSPYLLWILFASYLNFYVWWYNLVTL